MGPGPSDGVRGSVVQTSFPWFGLFFSQVHFCLTTRGRTLEIRGIQDLVVVLSATI